MTRAPSGVPVRLAVLLILLLTSAVGARAQFFWSRPPRVSEASIRGHMEMLASDAMNGRASGSRDEWLAATYIASQLRRFGLEPLGDAGGFVQEIATTRPDASGAPGRTWNVLARLLGGDRHHASQVIMLSAHLDHIGARGAGADTINNGADDDASGVTAVLELARVLARGDRPDRTILFVWFGSEETGGFGARHFVGAPPVPLASIVANLEFEMIGRPDSAVAADELWLTGFERTTLGPALRARGARIVADPHPEQNFFMRSDNITLARRGVVAQTVSSYGLHREYHTPADDLAHIDFAHMTAAIQSMVKAIAWLANTDFVPQWLPGKQPEPVAPVRVR